MRAKIGDNEVEGSAAEIAELLELMEKRKGRKPVRAHIDSSLAVSAGETPFVSEAVALDVLSRLPLAKSYKTMLKALYDAKDDWTSAQKLQTLLGFSTREFAGLLGAFGRRVSHTQGSGSRPFFDQYWDHERGFNLYRLPASVRSAMEKADIVWK